MIAKIISAISAETKVAGTAFITCTVQLKVWVFGTPILYVIPVT